MPNDRWIGKYIKQSVAGEQYKAYIPPTLPLAPPLNIETYYPQLEQAVQAITKLNSVLDSIPNHSLFIYMYVRKEALLSSQIEGTQSSFSDLMLFEHQQKTTVSVNDVEEVSNYVTALQYALKRLHEGFPLCLRLLRETHTILLQGVRGSKKSPGEFRKSQNWIGGTRPGNALFVPPPQHLLPDLLKNLEAFFHDNSPTPILVRAAISHVQFETIHPFLDGNGRLGRLLIILLLCHSGLLKQPSLYLSLFFKQNRDVYYQLLQEVRIHGAWETWLEFFLNGIITTVNQAIATIEKLNRLFDKDLAKIATLGRAKFTCKVIFEYLKTLPQVTAPGLVKALEITAPTARSMLNHLLDLGIVVEISGKKRDKVYVYKMYLSILEEGTEPLG